MRLGSILIGGMIGAMATVYLSQKRPGAVAWAANAMNSACSSAMRGAISRWAVRSASSAKSTGEHERHFDAGGSAMDKGLKAETKADAWKKLDTLMNSDPEVKREADKIKAESSAVNH